MSLETPWDAGRLGRAKGPYRLLFGHMHEDAEIERAAFLSKPRVFCIASAGCTAARLCDDHEVIACDINPVQLAYAERRLQGAAAELGDAERAMAFARTFMPLVGWRASVIRAFLALSDATEQVAFWRTHLDTGRFRASFELAHVAYRLAGRVRAAVSFILTPEVRQCASKAVGEGFRQACERHESLRPSAPPG